MTMILLKRLRQEDCELRANFSYISRLCLKTRRTRVDLDMAMVIVSNLDSTAKTTHTVPAIPLKGDGAVSTTAPTYLQKQE